MRGRLLYGVIVKESIETAVPLPFITKTLPVVGLRAAIDEIGITRVEPLLEVTSIDLFLQNFTVN